MDDQYSPQAILTRLFQIEMQLENIKAYVRIQARTLRELEVAVKALQDKHDEDG